MKRKTTSLPKNHTIGHSEGRKSNVGPFGPPRNRVTTMAEMVTVFMNSARKKRAKRMDEYSVWNPPTSSCSASTRSNGGRLASAVAAMRNTTKGTTPREKMFHWKNPSWAATMSWVESEPAESTAAATARAIAAS